MAQEQEIKQLISQFGELLNAMAPRIETTADRSGLTATFRFDADNNNRTLLRAMATLLADQAA